MPVARALFGLRGMRTSRDTPLYEQMRALGFRVLADREGAVALGAIGQPWRRRGGLRADADFATFEEAGYAKMALGFVADGRTLATETRVLLTDARSRRRFLVYWLAVRPFSGLIRRLWLRAAKRRLERGGAER